MQEPEQKFSEATTPKAIEARNERPLGTLAGAADENSPAVVAVAGPEPWQTLAYRIFVGPQGLRAGWSIFVFLAVVVVFGIPAQLALTGLLRPDPHAVPRPEMMIAGEGATLLLILIATLVMAKIERRPVLSYGFSGPRRLPYFMWGIFSGTAALSVLIAVLKLSGLLVFDGKSAHGLLAWKYAVQWAFGFLLVALAEESLVRGYVQFTLARGIGFWWAAVVLSVGFGLLHVGNRGESPIGIVSAAAIGLIFCLSLWLTKSLWWAVGMHAGWDWAQSYVYGVADSGIVVAGHLYATHAVGGLLWSGGPTGPEGSLYVLPILLAVAGGVWLTMKPKRHQDSVPLRQAA